jgi:hypothetical protein
MYERSNDMCEREHSAPGRAKRKFWLKGDEVMKKLAAVVLCAVFAFFAFGADSTSTLGTWTLDVKKSDFSKRPDGAPREETLTITENGWTSASADANGKKTKSGFDDQTNAVSDDNIRNDNISIKSEPTMSPWVRDLRVSLKDSGKEVARYLVTLLPDGNTLVIYGSGLTQDGKQFSDVSYYKRVK